MDKQSVGVLVLLESSEVKILKLLKKPTISEKNLNVRERIDCVRRKYRNILRNFMSVIWFKVSQCL